MMAVPFTTEEWILEVTFILIYGTFLFYDLFKRGEPYGYLAYLMALLPANYLWYLSTKHEYYSFGATGAMLVLTIMWFLCVVRDIFIKNKESGFKDADDVALILIIGLLAQFIVSAVLPNLPNNEHMMNGTSPVWKYFYLPFNWAPEYAPSNSIFLAYKIMATLLTVSIIIPIIIDLRDTKINIVVLLIITAIFIGPFAFLAFLWLPEALGVLLILICVIFFILLLILTKGEGN